MTETTPNADTVVMRDPAEYRFLERLIEQDEVGSPCPVCGAIDACSWDSSGDLLHVARLMPAEGDQSDGSTDA